jgi:hypothetical protein
MRNIFLVLGLVFLSTFLYAQPPKAAKAKHADKNKDGVVDQKEIVMEKKWVYKNKHQYKVNTPVEVKYDKNKNGWIDPSESKELLKDRYILIMTDGQARVDTVIEAEYDINKDGIIDKEEAVLFRETAD